MAYSGTEGRRRSIVQEQTEVAVPEVKVKRKTKRRKRINVHIKRGSKRSM